MKRFFQQPKSIIAGLVAILVIWIIVGRWQAARQAADQSLSPAAVPVEIAQVERGPMALRRVFSGSLAPDAEFVIAPKVSGRLEQIYVDLGDVVEKGQVVAELDNDEFVQAVALAEADLMVAKANLMEARSALEIASRELKRFETLRSRGVASDSQLDAARADQLSKQAAVEVARAQLTRADALLETARIRLGYTRITAAWSDEGASRVVSERFVDVGQTVAANAPLLAIVSLDPITGVIHVTEKDYARLLPGQAADLTTDAFPDVCFRARVNRISPVFGQTSRQARVELKAENPEGRLKPGMFIRATIALDRVEEALIVPEQALTRRDDQSGVFLVDPGGRTVAWQPVEVGIRDNGRVEVKGPSLSDLALPRAVVVLGQQLLSPGAAILIPEPTGPFGSDDRQGLAS